MVSALPPVVLVPTQTLANAGRYRIQYGVVDGTRFLVYLSSTVSEYTLRSLILGLNYSISISASLTFREYTGGNCYSQYLYGDYSDPIYNVTKESGIDEGAHCVISYWRVSYRRYVCIRVGVEEIFICMHRSKKFSSWR